MRTVLLTGATGFVGTALYPALLAAGLKVRSATRQFAAATARDPDRNWVYLDVELEETLAPALQDVEVAYYLVHSMGAKGGGGDWEQREEASARRFAEAAARAGVKRIVYLGGVAPSGRVSRHLRSRLRTGEVLRQGTVPVVELRAGMIIGAGSESWQIVRDLSLRLPVMVLPAWLQHRSEPVAIADVVAALVHAGSAPDVAPGCYALPGPEALTGQEILVRVAALRGLKARAVRVPFITPRLSSYWIGWVTRADLELARELVEGLVSDLVAREEPFWAQLPGYRLTGFDPAAQAALSEEARGLPPMTAALEWAIQHLAPWKRAGG
ncbi:MAG: NAD-dependent epimerase/dehydratase [Myxococcaceae bacterium]|nr:NAD-dependent epimerase/dehydratase [Myxococcaceae bacterium]